MDTKGGKMNNYQAMYDAVITAIGNECIGYKVSQFLDEMRYIYSKPHILLKPKIYIDGNMWCASYGNMPEGIQGFGETPEKAIDAFDYEYYNAKIIRKEDKG
jgi:hypothetical protein